MTKVRTYTPKPVSINALQVLPTTTKAEILDFCPEANVGQRQDGPLVWCCIPVHGHEGTHLVDCRLADFIVRYPEDQELRVGPRYVVLWPEDFHALYQEEQT